LIEFAIILTQVKHYRY